MTLGWPGILHSDFMPVAKTSYSLVCLLPVYTTRPISDFWGLARMTVLGKKTEANIGFYDEPLPHPHPSLSASIPEQGLEEPGSDGRLSCELGIPPGGSLGLPCVSTSDQELRREGS